MLQLLLSGDEASKVRVQGLEGLLKDIIAVGVLQLIPHECKEHGEVDGSRRLLDHVRQEGIVLDHTWA